MAQTRGVRAPIFFNFSERPFFFLFADDSYWLGSFFAKDTFITEVKEIIADLVFDDYTFGNNNITLYSADPASGKKLKRSVV